MGHLEVLAMLKGRTVQFHFLKEGGGQRRKKFRTCNFPIL